MKKQKDQDLTMPETKINLIKKSTDSVGDYLAYFERVRFANNWSDEEAAVVFPACLEVGTKALQGLSSTTLSKFSLIKNELALFRRELQRSLSARVLFLDQEGL